MELDDTEPSDDVLLAFSLLSEVAGPCTLPLVLGGEDPEGLATGVLFEIADEVFIITAGHVADTMDGIGNRLTIVCPDNSLVGLSECRIVTCDDDGVDAAVIRLPRPTSEALVTAGFKPARQSAFDCEYHVGSWPPRTVDRMLCPFGFPRASSPWDRDARRLTVSRVALALEPATPDALLGFDPVVHLALGYPSNDSTSMWRVDGTPVQVFEPHGLSGAGVWSLPVEGSNRWTRDDVRLVAFQQSWLPHPSKLRCTRVAVVVQLLMHCFPELRKPLSMYIVRGEAYAHVIRASKIIDRVR